MSTPQSNQRRGLLIVFEGLDRSGKSTQCRMLAEALRRSDSIAGGDGQGTEVREMRFPDRTTNIGASIDSYLRSATELPDHAVHLLFSANRWEAAPQILSSLSTGATLVVDRYSFSGAVYSAAKQNPALSLDWAWQPEIGLPKPDLVFYLTVSEDVAERRGGFGAERYEKKEMQRRVAGLFTELLHERLGLRGKGLHIVDADRSVEEVHAEILGIARAAVLGQGATPSRGPVETFTALNASN